MKILIVSPFFYPAYAYGGPIEVLYRFGKSWLAQKHQVNVVTINAGLDKASAVDPKKWVQVEGMSVRYCKRIGFAAVSFGMLNVLCKEVRRADVIWLNCVYSFPTIPTLILCRIFHKKLIWTTHGALQQWEGTRKKALKKVWNFICQIVIPNDAVLHFTSNQEAAESVKKIKNIKHIIVPNGVFVPSKLQDKKVSEKVNLLFLGRIDRKKGLENLLSAITLVDQTKYRLVIYGSGEGGYVNEIRKLIKTLKVDGIVTFNGSVARTELERIFAEADVFIFPSYTENFGNVVAEALAHAVPVIASRGTPWEELEIHRCGLWVENDPHSLAEAFARIQKSSLIEMGQNGRRWMQQDFQWSDLAKRIISDHAQ